MTQSNSPADSMVASREMEMKAFDRLPLELRRLLMETRVQWSALSVEWVMARQGLSVQAVIARLLEMDAQS